MVTVEQRGVRLHDATGDDAEVVGRSGNGAATIDDVQEWTATAVGDGASRKKVYRYSVAGRLVAVRDATTGVDPVTGEPVSTWGKWTYAFDSDGNRGSYVYDTLGRVPTLPGADSPTHAAVTLGYFDDDLPRSVTSNGVTTTFTLDAPGRRDFLINGSRGVAIHGHRIRSGRWWQIMHYHRRFPGPGGGIGRHRPWEGW